MTIKQELLKVKERLILAHIEACAIEETVKSLEPNGKVEKLLKRIEQLKEELESCI